MKHCDFLVLSSSKLSSTPRQSTWPFRAEFSPSSVKRQTWSHADGFSVVSMASHMSVSSSHLEKYTSFPERPLYWFYITNILSYLSYNFIDDIITIDSRINILVQQQSFYFSRYISVSKYSQSDYKKHCQILSEYANISISYHTHAVEWAPRARWNMKKKPTTYPLVI